MVNLDNVWQSGGNRVCRVQVTSDQTADLSNIRLQSRENTLVTLEVALPPDAVAGELYTVFVEQRINGAVRSRVTLEARTVGTPVYKANRNPSSLEIHKTDCYWAKRISGSHVVPYDNLELAIRRGFNGCRYCLPDYSID